MVGGASVVLFAGGIATGWRVNNWRHDSEQLKIEQTIEQGAAAAATAAVDAIKSNRPIYTTINKGIEKEFRSEVRYTSPDCSHTPESWRLLDRAYQAAGGEPFGSGAGLPTSTPTTGRDVRGDDTGADRSMGSPR